MQGEPEQLNRVRASAKTEVRVQSGKYAAKRMFDEPIGEEVGLAHLPARQDAPVLTQPGGGCHLAAQGGENLLLRFGCLLS